VYYYQHLIAAVGRSLGGNEICDGEPAEPAVRVADDQLDEARKLLAESGVDLGRPVVALAAGSTNSNAKRWPAESFADLARRLSEMGSNAVLLGTRGEAEIARNVGEIAGTHPIDLTGSTTVAEAAAILAVADLLISNDTGLAHLGPAVGTRTLVIFGPTDPVTTRPYSDLAEIIREPVECSPCMLRECPIDHRCMTRISTASVFSRVKTLLKE
jgi:heptosyltransferase-2